MAVETRELNEVDVRVEASSVSHLDRFQISIDIQVSPTNSIRLQLKTSRVVGDGENTYPFIPLGVHD